MTLFLRNGPRRPFDDLEAGHRARRFGMVLFLVSLGVLFAATICGYLVIRVQLARDGMWPDDLPRPPAALALSTAVLLLSSWTVHRAVARAAGGDASAAPALRLTTALGIVFLALQGWCWWAWFAAVGDRWTGSDAYRMALSGFYLLTGLHALHVLGGLIGLAATTTLMTRRPTTRARGVEYCAMYWHFLAGVWLVLYALLWAGR